MTFELHRYVVDVNHPDEIHGDQLYAKKTTNASSFSPADNENGAECCKFDDLLVYSPKGELYGYYVVEKKIKGYKSEFSLSAPTGGTESGNASESGNAALNGDGEEVLVFSDAAGWDTQTGINNALYAKNTYTPSDYPINLSGTKVWDDWHDVAGLRPHISEFGIILKRSTGNESGQANKIESHEVEIPYVLAPGEADPTDPDKRPWIRWVTTGQTDADGRDQWTYEIGGLPQYAPNGQPYLYTITEKNRYDGYQDLTKRSFGTDSSNNFKSISNSLEMNYTFRKYWHDGSNTYHMRPDEITVVLQYSTDGGSTWQDMVYQPDNYNLNNGKNPQGWFAYPDAPHQNALAVTLTAENRIPLSNPNANTWQYKFTNLPSRWMTASGKKEVKYRCIEVKVGSAKVNYGAASLSGSLDTETSHEAGGYTAKYQSLSNSMTEVDNFLTSAKLKVKKVWTGDQDDLYNTRPDSLTFRLERRNRKIQDGSVGTWQSVEVPGDNGQMVPYTFHLTKDDGWERTLEDLPVSFTDENGDAFSLEFRAVEEHADESLKTVQGAQNYVDLTDYANNSDSSYTFDPNNALNTSVITNKLMVRGGFLEAHKEWYASNNCDDDTVIAAFELQYQREGEEAWQSFDPKQEKPITKKSNGTSQSVRWDGLPQYDREGHALTYQIVEHTVPGYEGTLVNSIAHMEVELSDDDGDLDGPTDDAGSGTETDTGDGDLSGDEDESGTGTGTGGGSESGSSHSSVLVTILHYFFVNVELQDYTVTKTWNKPGADASGTVYVPKSGSGFTSTFVLQQKIGDRAWESCTPPRDTEDGIQTLTDNGRYTWHDLPKYTDAGVPITYRAVETQINGNDVTNNTDGNYIVTYDYDGTTPDKTAPAFDDTQTDSANRLVYGFVNLSKEAAYLAPGVTDLNADLSGVEFKIQKDNADYATGILTDSNGNLTRNSDGTYGAEHRYLVPGTYTLLEVNTHNNDYTPWASGVEFTVGTNGGNDDTGEHGTAWIYTDTTTTPGGLTLKVTYLHPDTAVHSFGDNCAPGNDSADAYNLESRGVIEFTKKGPNGADLDTHTGSTGETPAYFGVYTDAACMQQVAGMTAADGVRFVLTDKAQDGSTLTAVEKSDGVPYLRSYGSGFTLLSGTYSGTYYVRELVAPAGHKLSTTVREVNIPRLETTAMGTDLSAVYGSNKGVFTDGNTPDYLWSNDRNCVTLYKKDQFGRNVELKPGGYLELKFEEGTFPTGENIIRLYQKASKPATKTDGTTQVGNENGKWSIVYDESSKNWTITGLFAMGKQYTLSEPADVVPDENIQAKSITFTIGGDGQMNVPNTDTHTAASSTPTQASGRHDETNDDYKNYYQPSGDNNVVVLRDVARFRKNVALKKLITGTTTPIQYISFNLYHVIHNSDGMDTEELVTDPPLTTGADGVIDLSQLDISLKNRVTGSPLNKGLDLGDYFFREVEMGASDGYRLVEDIPFKIKAVTPANPETADYADYAEVKFTTSSTVTQSEAEKPDRGTVCNAPVQDKSLKLTKKDEDGTTLLSGARFKLEYVSITNGDLGSKTSSGAPVTTPSVITTYAMTDTNGKLKTAVVDKNGNWTIGGSAPDISAKGTYTLTELRAPTMATNAHGYSTYTDSGEVTTPEMLRFFVDSDNEIKNVSGTSGYILDAFAGTGLVETPAVTTGNDGDLSVTVQNRQTVLTIDKLNDLFQNTKTKNQQDLRGEPLEGAKLEIYEGVGHEGTPISQNYPSDAGSGDGNDSNGDGDLGDEDGGSSGTSGTPISGPSVTSGNTWTLTGVLSENTVYTLHEKEAPVGFLEADDLYFCLFGTRTAGGTTESQLYVWTGSAAPPATVTPEALSAANSSWSKTQNLDDNDLTMVDEAIIAPVDARKVLRSGDNASDYAYSKLPGATFTVSVSGGAELGTVVSDGDGYLKWETLNVGNLNGLVYNSDGKRVAAVNDAKGQTVILRQNDAGYTFTETDSPVNAYNEGVGEDKVYRVAISDQNYIDYKAHSGWAIDLVAAEANTPDHTAALAAKRETTSASDLINPAYHSTVTLHKYDSDPEGNTALIAGAKFTLTRDGDTEPYQKASMGGDVHASGVFTTDASGNLSITIPEKGTYTLKETQAAPGYKLDERNTFSFTLVDKSSDGKFDYDHTTTLEMDANGVPNERQYGDISLTKKDAKIAAVALSGVKYELVRTDKPDEITQYFNDAAQYVYTGKAYTAEYVTADGERRCKLTEKAGQTGQITISGLDWGEYKLTEVTNVSRYQLDMTDSDQRTAHTKTFTIHSGCTSRSEVLCPDAQSDTNSKNSVKFHKTDNGTNPKNLSGAVFRVLDANDREVRFYLNETTTETANRATSGSDGTVTIYGLPTDPDSDTPTNYQLEEVTAPAGYVRNPNRIAFSINRKGVVKMGSTAVDEVLMADKPIRVTLQKKGELGDTLLDGAVFTLTPDSGSHFVGTDDSSKPLTLSGGTLEIPIETLIGGHSYTLTETKAPDGYEATAVVHFKVETDGQVTITSTSGGYRGNGSVCCDAVNELQVVGEEDEYKSTLSIRDEKIRVKLTKVDSGDPNTRLGGVTFTLTPFGTDDKFTPGFADDRLVGDVFTDTTPTTGENLGVINIPDGLLVHGCDYLLRETAIGNTDTQRYYLCQEAQNGVTLSVALDGSISVTGGSDYYTVNTADNYGTERTVQLTVGNPKVTEFEFTKAVAGNMGDVTGSFTITMEVYEPDDKTQATPVFTQTVTLKKGEYYSSVNGKKTGVDSNGYDTYDDSCAFGLNAIPVGALLKIREDPDPDYEAVTDVTVDYANAELVTINRQNEEENAKGEVWLRLTRDYNNPASFVLTNRKEVAIDAGVVLEQNAPYALAAIAIPALWLYLRARRRRKGGDDR